MVSLVVLQAVESAIPYRTGKSFRGIDPVIFTELPENFFDLCKKLMTVFVIPAFQDNCKFISSEPFSKGLRGRGAEPSPRPAGRGIPYTLSAPQGGELKQSGGLFQEGDALQERASPFPKILKL